MEKQFGSKSKSLEPTSQASLPPSNRFTRKKEGRGFWIVSFLLYSDCGPVRGPGPQREWNTGHERSRASGSQGTPKIVFLSKKFIRRVINTMVDRRQFGRNSEWSPGPTTVDMTDGKIEALSRAQTHKAEQKVPSKRFQWSTFITRPCIQSIPDSWVACKVGDAKEKHQALRMGRAKEGHV